MKKGDKHAFEMGEVPALLEPSVFRDTNKISLPLQVNPLTEDNLKNALWYALEEFGVYGEVNLGKGYGRIDLLCEHSDVRVGIECKKLLKEGITKQLCKYTDSGCLNALYLAPLAIGNYEFLLDYIEAKVKGGIPALTALRKYYFGKIASEQYNPNLKYGEHKRIGRGGLPSVAREIQKRTVESDPEYQEEKENRLKKLMVKYREGIDVPPYGIILYNPLGEIWVAGGAKLLRDYTSPSYSPTKEAFIKYSVWKHFKNLGYIVAAECELPGATTIETKYVRREVSYGAVNLPEDVPQRVHKGHNTIDITTMPKSRVNEKNPSKLNIMGVECKASINKDKLSKQLESYLNSGDLSDLYLAIPQELENRAIKLLTQRHLDEKEDLTSVGILSVTGNGEIEEIKEAKELEMKKPSFFSIEKRRVEDGRFRERIYK